MKLSVRSLLVRILAALPLLVFAATADAGNRRPNVVIIVVNNKPKPIVSHL